MAKDDLRAVQTRKAAKLLNRAYRRQKRKSWSAVARKYGLANARAYMIAHGKLLLNPVTDGALMRAVLREDDTRRARQLIAAEVAAEMERLKAWNDGAARKIEGWDA